MHPLPRPIAVRVPPTLPAFFVRPVWVRPAWVRPIRVCLIWVCLVWMSLSGVGLGPSVAVAQVASSPVGFEEQFALAENRSEVLGRLIPGTEEYYYYHCLHAQHSGRSEKVRELLEAWKKQHGQTSRFDTIASRQMLLDYPRDPERTLRRLREELHLQYDHERQTPDRATDLPTALAPHEIDAPTILARWQARKLDWLDRLTDRGLWLVDAASLDARSRHRLLERLSAPDFPGLLDLIVADLRVQKYSQFGSLDVHRNLTLAQLDTLRQRLPQLLNQEEFIRVYLARLVPVSTIAIESDLVEQRRYLDRLLGFARALDPDFNSLKAEVLYHALDLARHEGRYDRRLFREYLQLPRSSRYTRPDYSARTGNHAHWATYRRYLHRFPTVRDDWPLVRDHLLHFFTADDSPDGFAPFLREDVARRVFAEAKIVAGVGDLTEWQKLLDDPEEYTRLQERVDLDFAPTCRRIFRADEPVVLHMDVKNVPTLLVKVYPIHALHVYRTTGREIDPTLALDGLVANHERVLEFDAPSWRRGRHAFEFPEIDAPGVYILDFIGGGLGSRAVIFKGRLRHTERRGAAGHVLRVFDETDALVPDAKAWIAGHEYTANDRGVILVPYTNQPEDEPMVLSRGDGADAWATLTTLSHAEEEYELEADIHLETEGLIAGATAAVWVKPHLLIHGSPASLDLLEDVRLSIETTDAAGVTSKQEFPIPTLSADELLVRTFRVPPALRSVFVDLSGRIQNLARGEREELSDQVGVFVNGIDSTTELDRFHLASSQDGYALELRGKSGEPIAHERVALDLNHLDLRADRRVELQTDTDGRIELGPLPRIASLSIRRSGRVNRWSILTPRAPARTIVQVPAGRPVRIPYHGLAPAVTPQNFSLFETRSPRPGESPEPVSNQLDRVTLVDGFLELNGLAPGQYALEVKDGSRPDDEQTTVVRVLDASPRDGVLLSESLRADGPLSPPLHVTAIRRVEDWIEIQLRNATPRTRCHLAATRYSPTAGDSFESRDPQASWLQFDRPRSVYLTGRNLGDELRYILDRRRARRYPGNPMARPGLLLNPWTTRETTTGRNRGSGGDRWQHEGMERKRHAREFFGLESGGGARAMNRSSNLDFLPSPAVLLPNLAPDEEGVVRVPWSRVREHPALSVVATDGVQVAHREHSLPRAPWTPRDRTLREGLDPERRFSLQRRVTPLRDGATMTLERADAARFEAYDSLPQVYRLFSTLSGDPTLAEFEFLCRWPEFSRERKQALYSKHAGHELHFFLHQKDPEFFTSVVLPYLRHKKDRTFLDHYFLGDDLRPYLEPWRHSRLNTLEKILLASRHPEAQDGTTRHVQDLQALRPTPPGALDHAFQVALQGSALEVSETDSPELARPPSAGAPDRAPSPVKKSKPGTRARREAAPRPMDSEKSADSDLVEKLSEDRKQLDFELRQQVRSLYRKTPPTRELAESHYFRMRAGQPTAPLVPPNEFWSDFALHRSTTPNAPFLSAHLTQPTSSFTEMICALAVLDLPFSASPPTIAEADGRLSVQTDRGLIVFHEELLPIPDEADSSLLVGQNFFRLDDRYRYDGNERRDHFVTDEFLVHVVYGSQVVVTNPSSSTQRVEVLLQIPAGAIPVQNGFFTTTRRLTLSAYSTERLEYFFYFPRPGTCTPYPVHVSRGSAYLTHAPTRPMRVVRHPSQVEPGSWLHVSQNGTDDEVFAFLATANLGRLDLSQLAWRLQAPDRYRTFGARLLSELRRRHHYDPVLWSYALLHGDEATAREFLAFQDDLVGTCRGWLDSPLLRIDPLERGRYEHLEYDPLIHARVHPFRKRRTIENQTLAGQYRRFLEQLCLKRTLDDTDRLAAVYYFVLQDRIDEALDQFRRVNRDQLRTQLQYDHAEAYLDLFEAKPTIALAIADRYQDYPVARWRDRFRKIARYAREATTGETTDTADPQSSTHLATTEPTFDFEVDGRRITVDYRNLSSLRVNYYRMDVELLFSRQPFVRGEAAPSGSLEQWSTIQPAHSDSIDLPQAGTRHAFEIPDEFASANVMVELVGAGQRRSRASYVSALTVQLIENYGQLRVSRRTSGAPLPLSYVKVYARTAQGKVQFYKDGYTDLLGRFDYASLSADELDDIDRFAVLVLHDADGAVIREAVPPKQ